MNAIDSAVFLSTARTSVPIAGDPLTLGRISHGKGMKGLSLVELMVALVITSIILLGVTQVFVASRGTYQTDEGLARLQENARFAVQFLTQDIRMAGSTGCRGEPKNLLDDGKAGTSPILSYLAVPGQPAPFNNIPADEFNFAQPVAGFDASGMLPNVPYNLPTLYPPTTVSSTNPSLDPALAPWGAVEGSDVLVLRFQSGDAAPVNVALTDGTQVAVVPPHGITDGQIVLVSDCETAVLFQVTGVTSAGSVDLLQHAVGGTTPGNTCANWDEGACPSTARRPRPKECPGSGLTGTKPFCPGAQAGRYRVVTYFVGAGGGTIPTATPVPSLFRAVFDESGTALAEELVEGVENMQVSYGVDTDLDDVVDNYMTADQVATGNYWSRVITVRIGLLIATSYSSSQSEMGADTAPYYDIGGMAQVVVPPDNRRRRVVVETVKIRGRPAI